MPLYDVRCKKCGCERELVRGINDKNPPCQNTVGTVAAKQESPEQDVSCGGEQETLLSAVAGRVRGGTPRFHR